MQPDNDASRPNRNGAALSVLLHVVVLLTVAGVFHRTPKLALYRLPGAKEGVQYLTYYSPGSTEVAQSDIAVKSVTKPEPKSVTHSAVPAPQTEEATALNTERGVGNAGQSGIGDGNITIALQKFFPYPTPSLATLAHGTAGDVILNAVIDEHGKISELTLLQGLGPAIDNEVIQTVNQWTYTPATKDGIPVPSVQELHFHYERRG
jgi:periplasmic protein TonB